MHILQKYMFILLRIRWLSVFTSQCSKLQLVGAIAHCSVASAVTLSTCYARTRSFMHKLCCCFTALCGTVCMNADQGHGTIVQC
jgi:hypothetical protein